MKGKALDGMKVLEYAHLVSGPYCAKLLADLGAQVIKVEDPKDFDVARRREPFFGDVPDYERSGLFLYLNTNKMGITLNLRTTTGLGIFKELIRWADVFIENNPPKLVEKLGISYQDLSAVNPRLIMTSITPFGQTGPYRDYKGYDLNCWQLGGYGHQNTNEYPSILFADQRRPVPLKKGGKHADFQAALNGAVATMCAFLYRERTGIGQHVDVSAVEAVASTMPDNIQYWTYQRQLSGGPRTYPLGPLCLLPCKDGYVYMWIFEEHQWERLVQMMGDPEWAREEIFKDRWVRAQNFEALEVLLADWFGERSAQEVYMEAQARGIPLVPSNDIQEVVNSPQLQAREFFVEIDHPKVGSLTYPGAPFKLSETPWKIDRSAPLLGEHNEEVYGKLLGYSTEDQRKMKQAEVI